MNIRRIRLCLWSLAIAASVATLGLLAYGFLAADDLPAQAGDQIHAAPASRPSEVLPPLVAFQVLKTINLQRPLIDSTATPANPSLRLIGTILDSDHSAAVLAGPNGHSEIKGIGESFNGARVIAIEQDRVTVASNGQTLVLHLEKKP